MASGIPPNGRLPGFFFSFLFFLLLLIIFLFCFNLEKRKLWIQHSLILTLLIPESKFAGTLLVETSPFHVPA